MNKIYFLFFIALMLSSCQSAKDALTLKKKPSGDEFLVEKKNPLVMPPEFGQLPFPDDNINKDSQLEEEKNIKILINNDEKSLSKKVKNNSKSTSIEKTILEKIK